MRRIGPALAAVVLGTLPAVACQGPEVCKVNTPNGTSLDVRPTLRGPTASTIENGRKVVVVDRVMDGGHRWARLARYEAAYEAESSGWILKAHAQCEEAKPSDPSPPLCVLRNLIGRLDFRDAPGGAIAGTFVGGERVRLFGERSHDGQAWIHVDRKDEDNVIGLAFDAYLRCGED